MKEKQKGADVYQLENLRPFLLLLLHIKNSWHKKIIEVKMSVYRGVHVLTVQCSYPTLKFGALDSRR